MRPVPRALRRARNQAKAAAYLLPDPKAEEDYREGLTGILEGFEEEDFDEEDEVEGVQRKVGFLFFSLFVALVEFNRSAAAHALLGDKPFAREILDLGLAQVQVIARAENVQLVSDVVRGLARGKLSKAAALARMTLIAGDQTHKVNEAINTVRQKAAGAETYFWLTRRDDRVRPKHAAKDGHVFRYDSPPEDTGPPGHEPNCRCLAIGILPGTAEAT